MNQAQDRSNLISQDHLRLQRRKFLRGVATAVSLPMMESFIPRKSFAAATTTPGVATTASGMPLRTAFLYHPNGVNVNKWHPTGEGKNFQLGETHQPLADFKDKLQIFANLDQINATGGADGGGDHARGLPAFG